MTGVVALGAARSVEGFVLAGVAVVVAEGETALLEAWSRLPADTGLLILDGRGAVTLRSQLKSRPRLLTVVMPG